MTLAGMEGSGWSRTSEPNHLARPRGELPRCRWAPFVHWGLWPCDTGMLGCTEKTKREKNGFRKPLNTFVLELWHWTHLVSGIEAVGALLPAAFECWLWEVEADALRRSQGTVAVQEVQVASLEVGLRYCKKSSDQIRQKLDVQQR